MEGKTCCCVSKAIQCFHCCDHCVDKVEMVVVVSFTIRHTVMTHNIEKPGPSTHVIICNNEYFSTMAHLNLCGNASTSNSFLCCIYNPFCTKFSTKHTVTCSSKLCWCFCLICVFCTSSHLTRYTHGFADNIAISTEPFLSMRKHNYISSCLHRL